MTSFERFKADLLIAEINLKVLELKKLGVDYSVSHVNDEIHFDQEDGDRDEQ